MDRFAKQFGARVKQARVERGMTQAQLAAHASVGANYIPRIERGEMTPSVDAAHRIAQSLATSVDELCGGPLRRDNVQDAARAILALTEGDVGAFRRALRAVEQLRGHLRGGKQAPSPRDDV